MSGWGLEDNTDFPTVGDWVAIQALDNYSLAIIHYTLPRKTLLKRKEPGKKIEFQLIASNIDYGLIVQSANSLNLNCLERYLVMLNDSGSIFIDTPGMRELGNFGIAEGIDQTFEEISSYSKKCRFRDCTHVHENGCSVIEAVEQGQIDIKRYQNFLKLKKESEFYEMSYLEKRMKNKTFGKMVKNYKKMKLDK